MAADETAGNRDVIVVRTADEQARLIESQFLDRVAIVRDEQFRRFIDDLVLGFRVFFRLIPRALWQRRPLDLVQANRQGFSFGQR